MNSKINKILFIIKIMSSLADISDMSLIRTQDPQVAQLRAMILSKLDRNQTMIILSDYLTRSDATTILEDYVTSDSLDRTLSSYAEKIDLTKPTITFGHMDSPDSNQLTTSIDYVVADGVISGGSNAPYAPAFDRDFIVACDYNGSYEGYVTLNFPSLATGINTKFRNGTTMTVENRSGKVLKLNFIAKGKVVYLQQYETLDVTIGLRFSGGNTLLDWNYIDVNKPVYEYSGDSNINLFEVLGSDPINRDFILMYTNSGSNATITLPDNGSTNGWNNPDILRNGISFTIVHNPDYNGNDKTVTVEGTGVNVVLEDGESTTITVHVAEGTSYPIYKWTSDYTELIDIVSVATNKPVYRYTGSDGTFNIFDVLGTDDINRDFILRNQSTYSTTTMLNLPSDNTGLTNSDILRSGISVTVTNDATEDLRISATGIDFSLNNGQSAIITVHTEVDSNNSNIVYYIWSSDYGSIMTELNNNYVTSSHADSTYAPIDRGYEKVVINSFGQSSGYVFLNLENGTNYLTADEIILHTTLSSSNRFTLHLPGDDGHFKSGVIVEVFAPNCGGLRVTGNKNSGSTSVEVYGTDTVQTGSDRFLGVTDGSYFIWTKLTAPLPEAVDTSVFITNQDLSGYATTSSLIVYAKGRSVYTGTSNSPGSSNYYSNIEGPDFRGYQDIFIIEDSSTATGSFSIILPNNISKIDNNTIVEVFGPNFLTGIMVSFNSTYIANSYSVPLSKARSHRFLCRIASGVITWHYLG